jgi:ribosomal-protein-alanine N-acetyltransferase
VDRLWIAPNGLHIEPGTAADAETLAKLHAGAFYRGWPREEFAAYLADPRTTPAYVACDAGHRIAGFAMLRLAADEAELLTIAVAPRWRGKGIGHALMHAALDDLSYTPVTRMFLEVDESNAAAVHLYKREGFSRVGERRGYYARADGTAATALVMSRDLG